MAVAIAKLTKYYMSRINNDDISTYESVQRYIELVELYRAMQKEVKKDGPKTTVENANQSYIKSHPLISDMKNINAQLINLKKDIDRHIKEYEEELKEQERNEELTDDDLL